MRHPPIRKPLRTFPFVLVLALGACATAPKPSASVEETETLDAMVGSTLAHHGDDLVASVWLGGADRTFYEFDAASWRPAASAIKTAYLIELFARHADDLDAPIEAIAAILADDAHPAIAHFTAADRSQIRHDLIGVGARRAGAIMIHGEGVSNVVYNAAANVVTALCGGPEGLTAAIRARHPASRDFAVRRYMLAPRDVTGDNELTARALGLVWQELARGTIPGLSAATVEAIREVLRLPNEPDHLFKGGALDSAPPCRLRTGMLERTHAPLVYVVALTTRHGSPPAPDASPRLEAAARELTVQLTEFATRSPNLE